MGWLIAAGILLLLALLPLGVSVKYDEDGPLVRVIAGPVRFTVFPRPKKPAKEKNAKKLQEEKPKAQPAEKALPQPPQPPKPEKSQKKKGGSVTDFFPFVKMGLDFLGDFRRKLRLNVLELKLILAGDDPCDLALNYGRAWTALGNLMPQLEKCFVIKQRDIEVECDFTASETLVLARLDITITLGWILSLVAVYAVRAVIEFIKFKKKRKGGAAI